MERLSVPELGCKKRLAPLAQRICLLSFANQSMNCLMDLALQFYHLKKIFLESSDMLQLELITLHLEDNGYHEIYIFNLFTVLLYFQ